MSGIRILALDGGGSRAGILAATLGELYGSNTPGREIIRQFDFIAANSGGSIVLTALCCNYTPRDIEAFYRDPATLRQMFSPKWVASVPIVRSFLPRYSTRRKFKALKRMFDQKRQGDEPLPSTIPLEKWPEYLKSDVNLIVTAFDYDQERAAFFRSNRASCAKSSSHTVRATLAEAVNASTTPPIRYYDKPAVISGRRYWDGGMAGNDNPVLCAVIEALANRPGAAADMRVLSLGTGTSTRPLLADGASPPLGKPPDGSGLLTGVEKAAGVIFDEPPDAATFHAYVALGQPMPDSGEAIAVGNLVRLSPLVRPVADPSGTGWELPAGLSDSEFQAMLDLPVDAMRQTDVDLIWKVYKLWIGGSVRNQPIRSGRRLRCDIGHETFSEGAAHWKRIA